MREEWNERAPSVGVAAVATGTCGDARMEQRLLQLISERRRRSAHFAPDLFSDPAWDILLVLALAATRQQRVTVTSVCQSIEAPMTTALRWIGALAERGHLFRRDDITDKRRKFVELSPHALAAMTAYCTADVARLPLAA
jgi:DNA-binding MarR family transcriptional regulator